MSSSREREIRGEACYAPSEFIKYNNFMDSHLCSMLQCWHQACCVPPMRELGAGSRTREGREKNCVMSLMSNEQNARKSVDSMIQRRKAAIRRKSVRLARARRLEESGDRPLNILGCFALLHAIRSINSGERSRIRARRTAVAKLGTR